MPVTTAPLTYPKLETVYVKLQRTTFTPLYLDAHQLLYSMLSVITTLYVAIYIPTSVLYLFDYIFAWLYARCRVCELHEL